MASFLDLQNGFYNAFSQGLGFPPGSAFQIAQPSPPLVSGAHQDQAVWNYFNLIPPFSLTNNYVQSGGNQFFNNYSGLLSVLQGAPNTFAQDVGPACNGAWNSYAATLPLSVTLSMFPAIFQRWAATHGYMSVANKGANDLAAMILDPVTAAQLAIMPYSGSPPANPPTWDAGYSDLVQILAPRRRGASISTAVRRAPTYRTPGATAANRPSSASGRTVRRHPRKVRRSPPAGSLSTPASNT